MKNPFRGLLLLIKLVFLGVFNPKALHESKHLSELEELDDYSP
jgi:hypothetical protein